MLQHEPSPLGRARSNSPAGADPLSPVIAYGSSERNEWQTSFPAHAHASRQTCAHRISRWTRGRRYPAPGCTIAHSSFQRVLDEPFGAITLVIAVLRAPRAPAAAVSTDMSVW